LGRLHEGTDTEAAAAFLEVAPDFALGVPTLAQALGMRLERAAAALAGVAGAIPIPDGTAPEAWTTTTKWERLAALALGAVTAHQRAQALAAGLEMESLRSALPWDVSPRVFRWAVERLAATGRLVRADSVVRLASHRVALDTGARERADRLERLLGEGGFT